MQRQPLAIRIETAGSITELPAAEWDALAGGNAMASHGWLRAQEETAAVLAPRRYYVVRDEAGLLAALPAVEESSRHVLPNLDAALFGRLVRFLRWSPARTFPALVCGNESGYGDAIMVRPGCAAELRARVELALVEHVEALARSGGRTLCFRGLPAGSTLGALIGQRGYLRGREMPSSYLDLHFGSFAEYRRSLRSTHARIYKVLAQERNRGRRHGLVIGAVDDPRPLREELHRLLDEHWRRLNGRPFPYHAGFLERVKANLGERATISTARIGTEVVGVAVLLHAPAAMYVPIVGMDPRRGRPSSAYFNLVYNHPIEQGIQTGTPRLHMGKMQYLVKRRRGCRLLELDFHLRPRNRLQAMALRGLLPLRSRRIERLVEEA